MLLGVYLNSQNGSFSCSHWMAISCSMVRTCQKIGHRPESLCFIACIAVVYWNMHQLKFKCSGKQERFMLPCCTTFVVEISYMYFFQNAGINNWWSTRTSFQCQGHSSTKSNVRHILVVVNYSIHLHNAGIDTSSELTRTNIPRCSSEYQGQRSRKLKNVMFHKIMWWWVTYNFWKAGWELIKMIVSMSRSHVQDERSWILKFTIMHNIMW